MHVHIEIEKEERREGKKRKTENRKKTKREWLFFFSCEMVFIVIFGNLHWFLAFFTGV